MKNNNTNKSIDSIIKKEYEIICNKVNNKIPEWKNINNIVIPTKLALEQSSSSDTAIIKSYLFQYSTVIDLTGGLGVDTYYFSKLARKVTYVEPNNNLFKIVESNFEKLKVNNVEFYNSTAEIFLQNNKSNVDLIYCDPSRRNNSQKVFKLEDCEPNIINLFNIIKNRCKYLLLKTSPLLEIKSVIKSLPYISSIILISIDNELKEILYLFDFESAKNIRYITYLLNNNSCSRYEFTNKKYTIEFELPLQYLYEPDSTIMKLGNFSELSHNFKLFKISENSHLFTSNSLIKQFPGKSYKIIKIIKVNRKELEEYSTSKQYNLKVRNFPDSVDNLKKKLNISDGGLLYIFATKLKDNNFRLIICEKTNI